METRQIKDGDLETDKRLKMKNKYKHQFCLHFRGSDETLASSYDNSSCKCFLHLLEEGVLKPESGRSYEVNKEAG